MQRSFYPLFHNYTDLETKQQYLILDQQQVLRVNTPQDMPSTLTYFTQLLLTLKIPYQLLFSKTYLYVFTYLKMYQHYC